MQNLDFFHVMKMPNFIQLTKLWDKTSIKCSTKHNYQRHQATKFFFPLNHSLTFFVLYNSIPRYIPNSIIPSFSSYEELILMKSVKFYILASTTKRQQYEPNSILDLLNNFDKNININRHFPVLEQGVAKVRLQKNYNSWKEMNTAQWIVC